MSVDYDVFLGIGKRFLDKEEALDFLNKNTNLLKEEIEAMLDGETHSCMSIVCLDCYYSGQDWFVGYEVSIVSETMCSALIGDVVNAHARWLEKFGDIPARVVHAVKIW
jgi:hypothetical protein